MLGRAKQWFQLHACSHLHLKGFIGLLRVCEPVDVAQDANFEVRSASLWDVAFVMSAQQHVGKIATITIVAAL